MTTSRFLLETSPKLLKKAMLGDLANFARRLLPSGAKPDSRISLYRLGVEGGPKALDNVLRALDAVVAEQKQDAFRAGKTFILELAERALKRLKGRRLADARLVRAVESGRALLAAPDNPRVQAQSAVDAARAYLAGSPPEGSRPETATSILYSGARIATTAAALPPLYGRNYELRDWKWRTLNKAIKDRVPKREVAMANPYALPYFVSEAICRTIGSQAATAASEHSDLLKHLSVAEEAQSRETVLEILLSILRDANNDAAIASAAASIPFMRASELPRKALKTVDAIIRRWKADGYYAPSRPRKVQDREAFVSQCLRRFGFKPPKDYLRFLELCDGGQYDNMYLWGVGPKNSVLDNCAELHSGKTMIIGDEGNMDVFILRPDGQAHITNYTGWDEVSEKFENFTALLDRLIRDDSA